jgi:hypothetical protein
MLRTIFMIGLFAIGGLFRPQESRSGRVRRRTGIFGVLLAAGDQGLIIGGLIYLVIRIFSPDTARRLEAEMEREALTEPPLRVRSNWSGRHAYQLGGSRKSGMLRISKYHQHLR